MRPCFGLSLQTGTQFIAVIDIVNSVIILIAVFTFQEWHSERLLVILLELVNVFMGICLAFGASRRSTLACKLWIAYTLIHSSTLLIFISYQLIHSFSKLDIEGSPEELIIIAAYVVCYKAYAVFVAIKFIAEINRFGGLNETLVHFSDKEVEEFLYGTLDDEEGQVKSAKNLNAAVEVEPRKRFLYPPIQNAYNKTYEISFDNLEIEPGLLGKGKYGKIHSGNLRILSETVVSNHNSQDADKATVVSEFQRRRVAIKTLDTAEMDPVYFKALLSEVKIMIYLGEHPNIVALIGVCTAHIRKKHLWIVLELCELGNLYNHLQSVKRFCNKSGTNPNFLSLTDAYKWATQIARALAYMETKHVVHGDLAARNILLTTGRDAKVSDFGLSHKIIQSKNEKIQWCGVALPWRWMAIESLLKFEFSSKSDVWSYGVTLWEIFTLGDIPFGGANWNLEFTKFLITGSRLSQPNYASKEVYDILMTCWIRDPFKRPSFSELSTIFQKIWAGMAEVKFDGETQAAGS